MLGRSLGFLGFQFGSSGSLALPLLVGLLDSDFPVSLKLLHFLRDLDGLLSKLGGRLGQKMLIGVLLNVLKFVGSGVGNHSLLELAVSSGEQNQFVLVLLESGSVSLKGLVVRVYSSVIDGNTNRLGKSGIELGSLELRKGESSAVSDLGVVLSSAGGHEGSQLLDGSRENSGSFGFSLVCSSRFSGRLIEPCSDITIPVLSQVHARQGIIVLDHLPIK